MKSTYILYICTRFMSPLAPSRTRSMLRCMMSKSILPMHLWQSALSTKMQLRIFSVLECSEKNVRFFQNDLLIRWYPVTFLFKSGLNKDRATSHCLCWGSLKKSQSIKSCSLAWNSSTSQVFVPLGSGVTLSQTTRARKKDKQEQKRRPAGIKMLKAKQTAITKLQFGVGTKTRKMPFFTCFKNNSSGIVWI